MNERIGDFDLICIRDLTLRCIIGVNDEERHEKQEVIVNIALYADIGEGCRSDHLTDSVCRGHRVREGQDRLTPRPPGIPCDQDRFRRFSPP